MKSPWQIPVGGFCVNLLLGRSSKLALLTQFPASLKHPEA